MITRACRIRLTQGLPFSRENSGSKTEVPTLVKRLREKPSNPRRSEQGRGKPISSGQERDDEGIGMQRIVDDTDTGDRSGKSRPPSTRPATHRKGQLLFGSCHGIRLKPIVIKSYWFLLV